MAVLEEEVGALVRQLYDPPPDVRPLRTSISSVFVLSFADGPDKILKANDDERFSRGVRREQRVLQSLQEAGLSVSRIEVTQDEVPGSRFAFSVMPREADRTLSEWYHSDPSGASPTYTDAGMWLAELHRIDPSSIEYAFPSSEARAAGVQEREWIRGLVAEAALIDLGAEELFVEFAAVQNRPRESLIHGDYNANQVMIKDGRISYVVDWDWAQHGRPMRDLGLCLAYAKFYDRAIDEAVEMRRGYERLRQLTSEENEECLLWELYTLLRVTAGSRLAGGIELSDWGIGLIRELLDRRIGLR